MKPLYLYGGIAVAFIVVTALGVPQWIVLLGGFACIMLGHRLATSTPTGSRSEWGVNWEAAAAELGLDPLVRYRAREKSTMRGEINGHRVTVSGYHGGQPEIDVRFESGLRSLDLDRRSDGRAVRPTDLSTGDPAFDELYVIERHREVETETVLEWLNSERREMLVVLADALQVSEVEEDELEVRLGREEWTPSELMQAVNLCVLAASVLDRSHKSHGMQDSSPVRGSGIQDAVLPESGVEDEGPQDQLR